LRPSSWKAILMFWSAMDIGFDVWSTNFSAFGTGNWQVSKKWWLKLHWTTMSACLSLTWTENYNSMCSCVMALWFYCTIQAALINRNEVRDAEWKKREACNIIAWVRAMPHYGDLQSLSEIEEVSQESGGTENDRYAARGLSLGSLSYCDII